MAITTRSEYGLRAMILLAEQLGDERLSASEISRREDIPLKYLEQILTELKRAGLLNSRAGARGGYQLARPARDLTVGQVVTALDGPYSPLRCDALERTHDAADPTEIPASQRLRPLWLRLRRALRQVLDSTTIYQLTYGTQLDPPTPDQASSADDDAESSSTMFHI